MSRRLRRQHQANLQPPELTAFFTRKQLAARWQVSERTVDAMIAAGGVGAVQIGRAVRIAREEVERCEREGVTV